MAGSCSAETCMTGMASLCNIHCIFECLHRLWSIVNKNHYLHPNEGWKEFLRSVQRGKFSLCISSWEGAWLRSLCLRRCSSTGLQSSYPLLVFICPRVSCLPLPLSGGREDADPGSWIPVSERRHWTCILPCGCLSCSSGWGWIRDDSPL